MKGLNCWSSKPRNPSYINKNLFPDKAAISHAIVFKGSINFMVYDVRPAYFILNHLHRLIPQPEVHWSFLYNIHTYILGSLQPLIRIIDLVSHTTYVVCVNFIHKWRDLQFKVDSERQIFFRNLSWQFLIYSHSFCQKSAENKSP